MFNVSSNYKNWVNKIVPYNLGGQGIWDNGLPCKSQQITEKHHNEYQKQNSEDHFLLIFG